MPVLEGKGAPKGHPLPAAAIDIGLSPYRGVWEGLAIFWLSILGFITMMFPLGASPLELCLCVLCGGVALARRGAWPPAPWALPGVAARRAAGWRQQPVWLALAVFFAWALLSILWAVERPAALTQALAFTYTFLPFTLFWPLLAGVEEGRRRRILRWAVAGMVLALALFTIEVMFGQPLYRAEKALEGTVLSLDKALDRPAVGFAVLAWPAGLALAQIAWRRDAQRHRGLRTAMPPASHVPWAWILPAAFLLISLHAPSASARVGLTLGLLIYGIARLSPLAARALLVALTVAGPLVSVPVGLLLRRLGLMQAPWLPFSFRHRVEIWDVAARRILERPVLGWGLGGSAHIPDEGQISLFHPGSSLIPLHPHNVFLQALLELGVVGGLLYMVVGLALLWGMRGLPRWAQPTALAMYVGGVSVGCFAYGAWQTWWLSSLLLAAILLRLTLPGPDAAPRGLPLDGSPPRETW